MNTNIYNKNNLNDALITAVKHHKNRNYKIAKQVLKEVLKIEPNNINANHLLGIIASTLGQYKQAEKYIKKSLKYAPDFSIAYRNLADIYRYQNKFNEAITSYKRAINLNSEYIEAYSGLGVAYIGTVKHGQALKALKTAANLTVKKYPEPKSLLSHRLKHDTEQLDYIQNQNLLPEEYLSQSRTLKEIYKHISSYNLQNEIPLDIDKSREIKKLYNHFVYIEECEKLQADAINPKIDFSKVESNYINSSPEFTYVDNLLTPAALESLRRFCLNSTIWKNEYKNGYLGSSLFTGFATPLLLQIAEELRKRLPNIFIEHRLQYAWGFKCDNEMKAINLHADFAAININFWITHDEANLDADSGGLIIWDTPAPKSWGIDKYQNQDKTETRQFLKENNSKAIRIPYKENRAIIFNSTLFHESDQFTFRHDYESRRTNITLLYGRGLQI